MAPVLVSYALDNGTVVQFEIDPTDEYRLVGAEQVVARVQEAVRPAIEAAQTVLHQIARLRPAEVEVTFGIKVSGTANWVVAKAATEANFGVTLKWRPGAHPGEVESGSGEQ